MKKFTIKYFKDGDSITPWNYDEYRNASIELYNWAKEKNTEVIWNTSTELGINMITLLVVEGIFDVNEVEITAIFKDMVLKLSNEGIYDNWPEGFCDMSSNMAWKIIKGRVAERKRKNIQK